jgi:hypothetical protein
MMGSYRRGLKKMFESVTGYKVIGVEPNSVVLANKDGVNISRSAPHATEDDPE